MSLIKIKGSRRGWFRGEGLLHVMGGSRRKHANVISHSGVMMTIFIISDTFSYISEISDIYH